MCLLSVVTMTYFFTHLIFFTVNLFNSADIWQTAPGSPLLSPVSGRFKMANQGNLYFINV